MHTKWTPGPWTFDGETIRGAGQTIRERVPMLGVALPHSPEAYVAEGRANACLAAAAPEMYDALADLLDMVDADDGDDPNGMVAHLTHARAVMAKARGE
jgi:hypothetical protein